MNHVFRIVQDHAGERSAKALFISGKCTVQAVEAIGLGGGAENTVNHNPHPWIQCCRRTGRCNRRRIVAIAADVDRQIALRPYGKHVAHGKTDYRRLLKGRDEYCDGTG